MRGLKVARARATWVLSAIETAAESLRAFSLSLSLLSLSLSLLPNIKNKKPKAERERDQAVVS